MLCLLAALSPAAADADLLDDLERRFSGFDLDGDGTLEIRSLRRLHDAGDAGPHVLVFVEPRLLTPLADAPPLRARLDRLVDDVGGEGHRASLFAVDLEPGPTHRDGRLVLALREILRAVREQDDLAGALLVGRFPDAYMVRTCNWRKHGRIVLRKGTPEAKTYDDVRYLRRVPEGVAHRAEIVLCDLDGRWEDVYVEPRTELPTTVAIYPEGVPEHGGPCADLERGVVAFEDFFHVADGALEVREGDDDGEPAGPVVVLDDSRRDPEVGDRDRARPNAMARPDVLLSRLDARGTARCPRADVKGVDGEGLLDEEGRPQAVRFASKEDVPHWRNDIWEPDPVLERRLLAEYLDRNHTFRTGAAPVAWRPASIAHGLSSGYGRMARAASDWEDADPARDDLHGDVTLADVVGWFERPAILRTLRAHSDPWGSTFARGGLDVLAERVGKRPWSWTPREDRLEPSLTAACRGGKLDWFLLRTLRARGLVAPEPAFYVHTGCEGISPPGARNLPYRHPTYGERQGAEAVLFLANGLALVGRAKVFYDEPRDFAETLGAGATFGEAWARYFELESGAESWSKVGGDIGRKRAYFWSVLGDWTLRLKPRPR